MLGVGGCVQGRGNSHVRESEGRSQSSMSISPSALLAFGLVVGAVSWGLSCGWKDVYHFPDLYSLDANSSSPLPHQL